MACRRFFLPFFTYFAPTKELYLSLFLKKTIDRFLKNEYSFFQKRSIVPYTTDRSFFQKWSIVFFLTYHIFIPKPTYFAPKSAVLLHRNCRSFAPKPWQFWGLNGIVFSTYSKEKPVVSLWKNSFRYLLFTMLSIPYCAVNDDRVWRLWWYTVVFGTVRKIAIVLQWHCNAVLGNQ